MFLQTALLVLTPALTKVCSPALNLSIAIIYSKVDWSKPRINQANYFLRQNYDTGKNILLNRFVHLNGKIEKSWLDLSLNSFKIRCKQLFLQSNSISWIITQTNNYWVPNKPPTITAKVCTIILSKALDKITIIN